MRRGLLPDHTRGKGWSWDSNPRAPPIVTGHLLSIEMSILKSHRGRDGEMSARRQKELAPIILIIKTLARAVKYTIS